MNTITSKAQASAPLPFLQRLRRAWFASRRQARARAELRAMDEPALRDLGIGNGERSFWLAHREPAADQATKACRSAGFTIQP